MNVPVVAFEAIEGSMTTNDGSRFLLRVKRHNGRDAMLSFPHAQISNLMECASMQVSNGIEEGEPLAAAIETTGFQIGRGPKGEILLNLMIGEAGRIGFLLEPEMRTALAEMPAKTDIRH